MEIDIDSLLDNADRLLQDKMNRQAGGSYRSGFEFDNPFFVIVHEDVLESQKNLLNPEGIERVATELSMIKSSYAYVNSGPFLIDPRVPKGSPVLVCGAFAEACVSEQYMRLIDQGYEAYLSNEGILSLNDMVE